MRVSAAVVLQMHRDGYSDQKIADQTGAELKDVQGIITTHKNLVARGAIPAQPHPTEALDPAGLLAWAAGHTEKSVQRAGERAQVALEGLQTRRQAESELLAVTLAVSELEHRLEQLRSRQAALKPSRKAQPRAYMPAEVRAWARQAGVACPPAGVVPKAVVVAWMAARDAAVTGQ